MTQDLSRSFGQPLTSSLRGLLPSRRTEADDAEDADDIEDAAAADAADAADAAVAADDTVAAAPGSDTTPAPGPSSPEEPVMTDHEAAPASRRRANGARTRNAGRPTAGSATDSRSTRTPAARVRAPVPTPATPGTNRRWGSARVVSREHVDLLVLLALERGPGDGRAVVERLRDDSGGVLDAPERTVHRTLHRLTRNRLLARRVDTASGRPSYSLTETGQRATRARVREWRALTRAVDSILREGRT